MIAFPSGQRGETQDLLQYASWVRIPPLSFFLWFRGVMVSTLDFESNDPGSNPGETFSIISFYELSNNQHIKFDIV